MKKVCNIVSGTPRSATSTMMRILYESNIDVVFDNCKPADKFNPYGYFEHKCMFRPRVYRSWLPSVENKWVKIVNYYFDYLPNDISYKIIYMYRNIDDSSKSLQKYGNDRRTLKSIVLNNTKSHSNAMQVLKRPNVRYIIINFQELFNDLKFVHNQLENFLQLPLDFFIINSIINDKPTI